MIGLPSSSIHRRNRTDYENWLPLFFIFFILVSIVFHPTLIIIHAQLSNSDANRTTLTRTLPSPAYYFGSIDTLMQVVEQEECAKAIMSLATVATILGGCVNPALTTQILRVESIIRLQRCRYSLQEQYQLSSIDVRQDDHVPKGQRLPFEPLPPLSFPIQGILGNGQYQLFAGAIAYSLLILMGVPYLIWAFIFLSLRKKLSQDSFWWSNSAVKKYQTSFISTIIVLTTAYNLPPTFASGLLLIVDGTAFVETFLGFLTVLLLFTLVFIFLSSVAFSIFPKAVQLVSTLDFLPVSRLKRTAGVSLRRPHGVGSSSKRKKEKKGKDDEEILNRGKEQFRIEPHVSLTYINKTTNFYGFAESFRPFFDANKNPENKFCRFYFLEELIVGILVNCATLLWPRQLACTEACGALMTVLFLHVLFLLVVRPFRAEFEALVFFANAVLQLTLALLLFLFHGQYLAKNGDDEMSDVNQLQYPIASVLLAQYFAFIAESVLLLGWGFSKGMHQPILDLPSTMKQKSSSRHKSQIENGRHLPSAAIVEQRRRSQEEVLVANSSRNNSLLKNSSPQNSNSDMQVQLRGAPITSHRDTVLRELINLGKSTSSEDDEEGRLIDELARLESVDESNDHPSSLLQDLQELDDTSFGTSTHSAATN